MATVERTAYPRFPKAFSAAELQAFYTPDVEELEWVRRNARGQSSRLGLLVLLKVFQQMHYFPFVDVIPAAVIEHIRSSADIAAEAEFSYDRSRSPALFRHYVAIREFLGIQSYYGTDANEIAVRAAHEAAETMDQPVDIINATIDGLIQQHVELPAFSTRAFYLVGQALSWRVASLAVKPGYHRSKSWRRRPSMTRIRT